MSPYHNVVQHKAAQQAVGDQALTELESSKTLTTHANTHQAQTLTNGVAKRGGRTMCAQCKHICRVCLGIK
jgi:hypothetical protein